MITSLRNDRVKHVRALQSRRRVRQRERRLVFEGVRLVEEAARVGVPPDFVFHSAEVEASEGKRIGQALRLLHEAGVPCFPVSESVMTACSETKNPQGILAVVPIPDLPQPERPTFTLILDRVRDPGNLGTILRTALAAGVERVILAPGTVDGSNPKVVRAAMGAHLRLPLIPLRWEAIAETVAGSDVWLAASGGGTHYTDTDWTRPVSIIVGGEAAGAGDKAEALAQGRVFIPMTEGVESLNTAIAAAVLLYEVMRQRKIVA
jgi:TrmH family RNA methyltransferase